MCRIAIELRELTSSPALISNPGLIASLGHRDLIPLHFEDNCVLENIIRYVLFQVLSAHCAFNF